MLMVVAFFKFPHSINFFEVHYFFFKLFWKFLIFRTPGQERGFGPRLRIHQQGAVFPQRQSERRTVDGGPCRRAPGGVWKGNTEGVGPGRCEKWVKRDGEQELKNHAWPHHYVPFAPSCCDTRKLSSPWADLQEPRHSPNCAHSLPCAAGTTRKRQAAKIFRAHE